MTVPKPVFAYFPVFQAISALKARKLPDLSGRQIRQLIWLRRQDLTRAPAGAWSLAVTTVHRTVALCRSSFESHSCVPNKQKGTADAIPFLLVPVVGLEPTRCRHQRILSPSRLPIPSHRRINFFIIAHRAVKIKKKFCILSQKEAIYRLLT